MSDRPKSIRPAVPRFARMLLEPELQPPESFDPDSPLRESFAHLIRPEERFALELACASVLELTREAPMIVKDIPGDAMTIDLRAAVADLRYLAGYLEYTGASEGNCLERWERKLGDVAERLAERAAEIAGELEAALAAGPPAS